MYQQHHRNPCEELGELLRVLLAVKLLQFQKIQTKLMFNAAANIIFS